MGATTKISWTDKTFNPWWGCEKVSAGCAMCYAEGDARRWGYEVWGKHAPRRFFGEHHWNEPLRWNRLAQHDGVRFKVFCASMADVFEKHVEENVRAKQTEERKRLWNLIEQTPFLDWQLVTKRPENMVGMVPGAWVNTKAPKNVWGTITAENNSVLRPRLDKLNLINWAVRGISAEPLLEELKFNTVDLCLFDWIIYGGESALHKANARECNIEWIRKGIKSIRCLPIKIFVKQLGCRPVQRCLNCRETGVQNGFGSCAFCKGTGRVPLLLNEHKGADPLEWPADLRIQEFPVAR